MIVIMIMIMNSDNDSNTNNNTHTNIMITITIIISTMLITITHIISYANIARAWDSLRGSSVQIGTMQRRLAWPLCKGYTHTSRSVNNEHREGMALFAIVGFGILR